MRTSTAAANGYKCPKCGDDVTQDRCGRGFVRHKRNRDCHFEEGEKDGIPTKKVAKQKPQL